jgi:hypothetical protein
MHLLEFILLSLFLLGKCLHDVKQSSSDSLPLRILVSLLEEDIDKQHILILHERYK